MKNRHALVGLTFLAFLASFADGCASADPDQPTVPKRPYDGEDSDSLEDTVDSLEGEFQVLNTDLPLLGSAHGGSPLWDYCYGKSDRESVPTDPRSLVQPGISDGKAVHFNAFYRDCHVDPAAVGEVGHPKTCGELRTRFKQGGGLLTTGDPGAGVLFSGTDPNTLASGFGAATWSADQYNNLWKSWNLDKRPDNFDSLVAERFGSVFKAGRNPYPKPGEDPNKTNGGTGRLPEMFTQLQKDGKWTGRMGITCHACHSGGSGDIVTLGGGSSLSDLDLFLHDMLPRGYIVSAATLINLTHNRGTNNASDLNIAFMFQDEGSLTFQERIGLLTSGSTASMDTPAWWNMGHRPMKFVDGIFPMDATRADMVFYTPFLSLFGKALNNISESGQEWMQKHGPLIQSWAEALKSPEYPLPIDTSLAEAGAVLFHALDLWAPARKNAVPRPQGNGSCASCHGAYSPRYVNDPSFLATPELEGIASYIVPQRIMGTDSVRWKTNNDAVQTAGAKNFFGYPSTHGTPNDCGPQNRDDLRGDRELGYLAPPLFGVWATAPYLHNGSVPNVWEILEPADRQPIWRRVSTPARADQEGEVVMGFDTNLARAYDSAKLGWKYDEIPCEWRTPANPTVRPYYNCNPNSKYADPFWQKIVQPLYANLVGTWNVFSPLTRTQAQIEDRKIYNTFQFGQGNEGHEFTSVLTDAERTAIIEYLKTL